MRAYAAPVAIAMTILLAAVWWLMPESKPRGLLEPFRAEVVGVSDGDTITVLDDRKLTHKIRMAEIDAPEKRQDFGQRAKEMLSDLIYRKPVVVKPVELDRYGRLVAHVTVDGRDVGEAMVREGGAWVYRAYSRNPSLLDKETIARFERRGLWALSPPPIAPWDFRKETRAK